MNRLLATVNDQPFSTFVIMLGTLTLGTMAATDKLSTENALITGIPTGLALAEFLWGLYKNQKVK